MTELVSYSTAQSRLAAGWPHEAAWTCPPGKPLWVWSLEQSEGRTLEEILRAEARAAEVTGASVEDVGAAYGVGWYRLDTQLRKLGIKWPWGGRQRKNERRRKR